MVSTLDFQAQSIERVGGVNHENFHKPEHSRLYLPIFRLAFGDETTWGDKDVLVCFAGRGREAEFFAPFARSLTLTDGYAPCVEALRQRYEVTDRQYIHVVQGNGLDLAGIPSDSADMLTALIALMHIRPLHIRESYAREFRRVLRPGGQALIQVARMLGNDAKWETTDGAEYTVTGGGPNVGFASAEAATYWWEQYLETEYVVQTRTVPPDTTMPHWWWIVGRKR